MIIVIPRAQTIAYQSGRDEVNRGCDDGSTQVICSLLIPLHTFLVSYPTNKHGNWLNGGTGQYLENAELPVR